jgi:hypothetical protein
VKTFATAFAEAIELLWRRHPTQVPHVLVEASEVLAMCATMSNKEKLAYRVWTMHLARWEQVTELLERGPALRHFANANLVWLKKSIAAVKPIDAESLEERTRLLEQVPAFTEAANEDLGANVDNACDAVSKASQGSAMKAAPETIKKSYQLVNKLGGPLATFRRYQFEMAEQEKKKKARRHKKKAVGR